ncbi:unnamed protein product [Periconia digitata]|uniref:Uncharacterized protein n=1 Tax=Periconia digitata TaxID=1303443 RepID=A0A9W4XRA3_9PLEO|nr:unnamed protein product [Periconia digitata]
MHTPHMLQIPKFFTTKTHPPLIYPQASSTTHNPIFNTKYLSTIAPYNLHRHTTSKTLQHQPFTHHPSYITLPPRNFPFTRKKTTSNLISARYALSSIFANLELHSLLSQGMLNRYPCSYMNYLILYVLSTSQSRLTRNLRLISPCLYRNYLIFYLGLLYALLTSQNHLTRDLRLLPLLISPVYSPCIIPA